MYLRVQSKTAAYLYIQIKIQPLHLSVRPAQQPADLTPVRHRASAWHKTCDPRPAARSALLTCIYTGHTHHTGTLLSLVRSCAIITGAVPRHRACHCRTAPRSLALSKCVTLLPFLLDVRARSSSLSDVLLLPSFTAAFGPPNAFWVERGALTSSTWARAQTRASSRPRRASSPRSLWRFQTPCSRHRRRRRAMGSRR